MNIFMTFHEAVSVSGTVQSNTFQPSHLYVKNWTLSFWTDSMPHSIYRSRHTLSESMQLQCMLWFYSIKQKTRSVYHQKMQLNILKFSRGYVIQISQWEKAWKMVRKGIPDSFCAPGTSTHK